jgi:hypothetical protein
VPQRELGLARDLCREPHCGGYDAREMVGLAGGSIRFSGAFPWAARRVIHAPDC